MCGCAVQCVFVWLLFGLILNHLFSIGFFVHFYNLFVEVLFFMSFFLNSVLQVNLFMCEPAWFKSEKRLIYVSIWDSLFIFFNCPFDGMWFSVQCVLMTKNSVEFQSVVVCVFFLVRHFYLIFGQFISCPKWCSCFVQSFSHSYNQPKSNRSLNDCHTKFECGLHIIELDLCACLFLLLLFLALLHKK